MTTLDSSIWLKNRGQIELPETAISSVITIMAINYKISENAINKIVTNFYKEVDLWQEVDLSEIVNEWCFLDWQSFLESCRDTIIAEFYLKEKRHYQNLSLKKFWDSIRQDLCSRLKMDIQKKLQFINNIWKMTEQEEEYHYESLCLMLLANEALDKEVDFGYVEVITQTWEELTRAVQ